MCYLPLMDVCVFGWAAAVVGECTGWENGDGVRAGLTLAWLFPLASRAVETSEMV
jgi:hypothetical protein